MADLGDLVKYRKEYWKVLSRDSGIRTFILQKWDGSTTEVADDDQEVRCHATPTKWPMLMAPVMGSHAKRHSSLSRFVRVKQVELEPYRDWTPVDILRPGGPVFLSPKLGLMPGELLVLRYENGSQSRLVVTKNVGTLSQRKRRTLPKEPKTLWDHLDEEDD